MAHIGRHTSKDGRVSYRVTVQYKGQRKFATFPTMKEARDWGADIEAKLRQQYYHPELSVEEHHLSDAIARYKKEILPQKAESSQSIQGYILDWWNETLGDLSLTHIDVALIEQYKQFLWQKKGYSPFYVNLYLDTITHLMSVASIPLWKWLKYNPAKGVKRLRTQDRLPDITDAQLDRLLYEAEQWKNNLSPAMRQRKLEWIYYVIIIYLSTGSRRNEILNLRTDNVIFSEF